MTVLSPFGSLEVAGLVIAIVGLIPVLSQHSEETKLFTVGYSLLVVGMFATNFEAVILPVVLNFTEHGIGIGAAGVVFFLAAYQRRKEITEGETL
jgi:hypothetical protein